MIVISWKWIYYSIKKGPKLVAIDEENSRSDVATKEVKPRRTSFGSWLQITNFNISSNNLEVNKIQESYIHKD